jgi:acetylornithine deacetylase
LLDLEKRRNLEISHPLFAAIHNKVPINIGTIQGGIWPSSVPDMVVAEGRVGLVPGESLQQLKVRLSDELADLARSDGWLRDHPPRIEWLDGQFAPAEIPTNSPLVTALAGCVQRVTGTPPRVAGVTYGADMRHFVNTGGTPCVMFGAGDVRLAHAPDESIALDDVMQAITITAQLIGDWCGMSRR